MTTPGLTATTQLAAATGAFAPADLYVADLVVRRTDAEDPAFALAVALVAKAVRLEHVCALLDADGIALLWRGDDGAALSAPPDAAALLDALRGAARGVEVVGEGAAVAEDGGAPVVLSAARCYLRRYALLEQLVAARLRSPGLAPPPGGDDVLAAAAGAADDSQRDAVRRALAASVSVIAGGPGTGKTRTVALLLRVATSVREPLRVALCAPTGKAAGRLNEAVRDELGEEAGRAPAATTVHQLLGIGRDGVARAARTLDVDVVVVDEASMVSLPLLAEVLARTRPDARVVLVGDPDQLASIEVGAVLADIVEASGDPSSGVVVSPLSVAHRFADASGVARLADAVRTGSPAAVAAAIAADPEHLECSLPAERDRLVTMVAGRAAAVIDAARRGGGAEALGLLTSLGVLCATKRGDLSTSWWRAAVERRLVDDGVLRARDLDYVGRPLLVTRNDPLTGLKNGSVGVVVARGASRVAVFAEGEFPVRAIAGADTVWAMTIHKSQGSEYDAVVVSLPDPDSPVLTRELVYTAVTRSRGSVHIVAPAGSLDAALSRRVARASGLAARLRVPRD